MIADVVAWWLLLAVLGWAAAPLAARLSIGFPDRGLGLAKPLGLVLFTYVSWITTSAGAPHRASLAAALLAAVLVGVIGRRGLGATARPDRETWTAELLFLGSLGFFSFLRALEPDIFGAEKYMDFAFFNTLARAQHFPPEDPWLAGEPINYYYFGYLLFANLTRLTGVAPEVAYNLSIATLGGFLFCGATAIARRLTNSLWLGMLGGAAAAFLGNLDGVLQVVVERKGLTGVDYWRSSRVVPDTINEFPYFSLLHGDLHPHLTALAIDLPLYGFLTARTRVSRPEGNLLERSDPLRLSVLALLTAALTLTNPWDLPIVFTFLAAAELARRPGETALAREAVAVGGITGMLGLAAVVLSLPFALHFDAPFQGLGVVRRQTAIGPFATVFGLLLLPPITVLIGRTGIRLSPRREVRELAAAAAVLVTLALYVTRTQLVLALTALVVAASVRALLDREEEHDRALPFVYSAVAGLALAACEILYVKDSYGEALHRMNTVFKLYFQAWILLAIAFPEFVRRALALASSKTGVETGAAALVTAGIAASLCYPAATIASRWRSGSERLSLDGLAYLARQHSDDGAAIDWLRQTASGLPVVVEATGDPYSYFARVSSNTGLPTVLGWANHEGLWRGRQAAIDLRRRHVDTIYQSTDPEEVQGLLRRYDARFVFFGELERERFPASGLAKFGEQSPLFEPVFRSGATAVYAVRRAPSDARD